MAYYGKYETPAELLDDESLSRDEKISMLEKWRDDENDLIRAGGEGMEAEDRPNNLKEVKKALLKLKEATG